MLLQAMLTTAMALSLAVGGVGYVLPGTLEELQTPEVASADTAPVLSEQAEIPEKTTVSEAVTAEIPAANTDPIPPVQPETLEACDVCGQGELLLNEVNRFRWCFTAYTGCKNGATDHRDKIYERVSIKYYRCTNCEAGRSCLEEEEKTVCPYF